MDKSWMCFLAVIFYFDVWINTVLSEGICGHQCVTDGTCKSMRIIDRCYYVFTDQLRNWYDSHRHCQAQNLTMAKINNQLLFGHNKFTTLINDIPDYPEYQNDWDKAWLGGKTSNFEVWSFINGNPVNSIQLDLFPQFDIGRLWTAKEQCGCLFPRQTDFTIMPQHCFHKEHFLCRKKDCTLGGNCLVLVRDQKTWFEARSHCIGLGGDLFYLNAGEKFSTVGLKNSTLYKDITSLKHNVYIGIVHREWKWSSPETKSEGWIYGTGILYTNWAPNEPNHYHQECLMMYADTENWRYTGKWDDNECYIGLRTMCQREIEMPTTTETTTPKTDHSGSTSSTAAEPDQPNASSTSATASNNNGNGMAFIGHDPNTNRMIIIVIGVLLGVFFLLSIALISYIICRRHRAKKTETEDVEIIDNNYYEGTVERTVNNDAPRQVTTNNVNGSAGDRAIVPEKPKALPSYEDVHLYGNDVTDSLPKNKPVLKPKPKVGPVNGDVYSQVTLVRSTSPIVPDSDTTYMNAN